MVKVILHVHPRTASTSLLQYLRENEPPQDRGGVNLLHHCHYLNDRRHKWFSKNGDIDINRRIGKDFWKVITIVRDPVAINLSTFWAWSARHVLRDGKYNMIETEAFYFDTMDHHSPIHHMSAEVESFWGFDVKPFDTPWSIQHRGRLLVLKFEHIDTWSDAIFMFLGIPQAEFPHTNAAVRHIDLKFTDAYLRGLYRSPHVQKFYTEDQVNKFVTRYGGKPFKRIDGKKHVKVLNPAMMTDGFQPVRIITDEAQLDDVKIRGKIGVFGPHSKPYSEIEP